jgi:hypothetical protein
VEKLVQGIIFKDWKQMNDKSNNDTLIIAKSLKDVMVFYEFIGDRYVIAPHRRNIFYRPFLKSLFAKYTKS